MNFIRFWENLKAVKQDQMSQPQGKQWEAAALSLQNTGRSGYLNEAQNASDVVALGVQHARQRIEVRLKMAKMFKQYRSTLIPNKYGVTVTSEPTSTEEKICLTVYENKKVVPLTVKNSGFKAVYLSFRTVDFIKNIFTIKTSHPTRIRTIKQLTLEPGEAYNIKVHFHSDQAGFYEQLLDFKFETRQQPSDKFQIMRLLEVTHHSSFVQELLPTASTSSLCDLQTDESTTAERADIMLPEAVVPLWKYHLPKSIKEFIQDSDRYLQTTLLKWENYSRILNMLLYLEEIQLKNDIKKFNRDDVTMFRDKSNKNILNLPIKGDPGLSPSLLCGHNVQLTALDKSGVLGTAVYKGWIYPDEPEKIYMHFCERFWRHFEEGMRFNVKFVVQRMPLRIQHRAATLVYKLGLKEVLFPTGAFSSHSVPHSLPLLNNNPEQGKAIEHIVAASAKPAPYLVFGPPGTGKTVTLVEAIKQIEKTKKSCKILACTPSNTATDYLFEKLLDGKISRHKLYRLYALNSSASCIPRFVQYNCNLDQETNAVIMPSKEELMKYNIMVTTLITAGRLVSMGVPPGHYSYIIVDEAGQAAETECIVPLAGLVKPQTCQVVLAGDPKQLGSIIISKFAHQYGMGVSLLERLMRDIDLYKSHEAHGFNNHFVTKLLWNYRSHSAILKIPNELFYCGQLLPYAPGEKCSVFCEWEGLPKKGFPLIFHGVAGTEERDSNCTSLHNTAEVEVLTKYLKALVEYLHEKGVTQIGPGEIGIIAPYRKQVEKIRTTLQKDKDLRNENILVGSVEKFQGKEFNIILVSTVRSNRKLTAHDHRFTLGFLNDEKRFNVAMTRAQALLIVVGDPRVLITDQTWNKFIHYCFEAGGYRGIEVSDAEEMSH